MNEVTTENCLSWVSNSLCLPRDLKWAGKLENALNPSSVALAFHPGSGASVRPCLHYSLPAPWAPTLDPLLIARVLEEQAPSLVPCSPPHPRLFSYPHLTIPCPPPTTHASFLISQVGFSMGRQSKGDSSRGLCPWIAQACFMRHWLEVRQALCSVGVPCHLAPLPLTFAHLSFLSTFCCCTWFLARGILKVENSYIYSLFFAVLKTPHQLGISTQGKIALNYQIKHAKIHKPCKWDPR